MLYFVIIEIFIMDKCFLYIGIIGEMFIVWNVNYDIRELNINKRFLEIGNEI